jgi:hypothetical protein
MADTAGVGIEGGVGAAKVAEKFEPFGKQGIPSERQLQRWGEPHGVPPPAQHTMAAGIPPN